MENEDAILFSMFPEGHAVDLTKEQPVKKTAKEKAPKKESPVDASWVPVREKMDWKDNLIACTKTTAPIGLLSAVVFYWQQTGLLDATTGFWTLIILGFLAGLSVGKYAMR